MNFPNSSNQRTQLVNSYDLECCKIIYSYDKDIFECSDWFLKGGIVISKLRIPNQDLFEKFKKKGFNFENNCFKPESGTVVSLNN